MRIDQYSVVRKHISIDPSLFDIGHIRTNIVPTYIQQSGRPDSAAC